MQAFTTALGNYGLTKPLKEGAAAPERFKPDYVPHLFCECVDGGRIETLDDRELAAAFCHEVIRLVCAAFAVSAEQGRHVRPMTPTDGSDLSRYSTILSPISS